MQSSRKPRRSFAAPLVMTIAAVPACIFTSSSGSKPATGTGPAVTDHRGDAPETRDHRGDDTGTAGTPTPDGGDTGTPVVMTNPPPPDRGGTATTTTGGGGCRGTGCRNGLSGHASAAPSRSRAACVGRRA